MYEYDYNDDYDYWQCPNCGWNSEDGDYEKDLVSCSRERLAYHVQLEYGGNPVDWDETWKCPECGTVFEFTNGNY